MSREIDSVKPSFQLSGTYRPQLDGMRATAVAAVVAQHAQVPHAGNGGHGVDIFFVLSGFLITSLLLEEADAHERLDLRAFYGRRWRRLSPALFIMLAITAPLFAIVRPFNYRATLDGLLPAVFYLSAWARATGSDLGWLGHTWSLSVEEVFYLVWPLMLVVVLRTRSRISPRFVLTCFGAAVIYRAGAVIAVVDGNWLYNAPDMRAEQLLAGCALASLLHHQPTFGALARRSTLVRIVGIAGALYIVADLCSAPALPNWYRGGSTAVGLATAAVIAWLVLLERDPIARVLSLQPLAWVGMRSYGIYLWHLPLFGLLSLKGEGTAVRAVGRSVALVLTIAAAEISLRTVEGQVRRRRDRPIDAALDPMI